MLPHDPMLLPVDPVLLDAAASPSSPVTLFMPLVVCMLDPVLDPDGLRSLKRDLWEDVLSDSWEVSPELSTVAHIREWTISLSKTSWMVVPTLSVVFNSVLARPLPK